jgi:UV DNA damage endonuclease
MVRLGSDQLPFYTHDSWRDFYRRRDVQQYASTAYARVGSLARELDVRMSMHPGQFTVLASDRADVAERSLEELEYHATIARWMGFGSAFQDFKINVHLSGKRGAAAFQEYKPRMTPELRNMLTIENDEYTSGLRDILQLENDFALVFDTHHHLIHSEEFITPDDDRFKRVIDSWRGVRPVIHYSVSRPEYLVGCDDVLPDCNALKAAGFASTKLRAHSDYYDHKPSNDMIAEFWPYADIMAEAKMKNLASTQLYTYLTE